MIENNYYVYGYYDKNDVPFYIGVGKGNRIINHLRPSVRNRRKTSFYNKLNKLIAEHALFSFRKLSENLSLSEALLREEVLIKLIGRKDLRLGPLCNLTDGGEGHKNYKKSDALKMRISEWSRGRKLSPEHREALRLCNTGKKHSDETKRKISEIQKGKSRPNYVFTENHINALKRRMSDPEYICKLTKAIRLRHDFKVLQYSVDMVLIREWDSVYDAALMFSARPDRIRSCCRKEIGKHKGFIWRFPND